jgi:hypothetical protein
MPAPYAIWTKSLNRYAFVWLARFVQLPVWLRFRKLRSAFVAAICVRHAGAGGKTLMAAE